MQTLPPSTCLAKAAVVGAFRKTFVPSNLNPGVTGAHFCHRAKWCTWRCCWQPFHRPALRLSARRFQRRRSPLDMLRNVGRPCKASSSLALRASRLRQSRWSVHCALRQGAASPSLATSKRQQPTCFVANQGQRVLQGKRKQCSIGSRHCLPTPRMRCLTLRSTGPIAACG